MYIQTSVSENGRNGGKNTKIVSKCRDATITFTQGFIINVHHLSSLHNQYNMVPFCRAPPPPPQKKKPNELLKKGPVAEGKSEKHYSESRKIVNETSSQTPFLCFCFTTKVQGQ
jgi:hypothetical protein